MVLFCCSLELGTDTDFYHKNSLSKYGEITLFITLIITVNFQREYCIVKYTLLPRLGSKYGKITFNYYKKFSKRNKPNYNCTNSTTVLTLNSTTVLTVQLY